MSSHTIIKPLESYMSFTFINTSDKKLALIIHNNVTTLEDGEYSESSSDESDGGIVAGVNASMQTDGPHLGGKLSGKLHKNKKKSIQVRQNFKSKTSDSEYTVIKNSRTSIKISSGTSRCSIYEIKELNGQTTKEKLLKDVEFFKPKTYFGNNNGLTAFGENIQKGHNVMIEISINGAYKCLSYAGSNAVLNGTSQLKLVKDGNEEVIKTEESIAIISIFNNLRLSYTSTIIDSNFLFFKWKRSLENVKFLPEILNSTGSTSTPQSTENGLSKWIIRKVPQSQNNSNDTSAIKDGEEIFILLDNTEKYLQVDKYGKVICEKLDMDSDLNAKWKVWKFRDE